MTQKNEQISFEKMTIEQVDAMSYFDLIGLLKETNRPPGGIKSIMRIAMHSFLTPESKVLEIGTSTGFTAIELARLVKCRVCAIDINEQSLSEGRKRAQQCEVKHLITFDKQDASKTTYSDNYFDMVFCGNVTSYIADKEACLAEYCRLLKPSGYVAAIPMYYVKTPPKSLVEKVSKAINFPIDVLYKDDWIKFYSHPPLRIFWHEDYHFNSITTNDVDLFVNEILSREHLHSMAPKVREALREKYSDYMQLFRENLSHMGFSLMLLRKEYCEIDSELFIAKRQM